MCTAHKTVGVLGLQKREKQQQQHLSSKVLNRLEYFDNFWHADTYWHDITNGTVKRQISL